MALIYQHVFLILFISVIPISQSVVLDPDYYKTTCPDFNRVVLEQVQEKQAKFVTTAAATLRLYFHDCMTGGCDGSILIGSTSDNQAEKEYEDNISLPGDAFDIIFRIKTALEMICPGVVSCADILTAATRNLLVIVGGPHYPVLLGRKDGLVSNASRVNGSLPHEGMNVDQMIAFFERRGFTTQEMVALLGAHTIGFASCKKFSKRLFNFSAEAPTDPGLKPAYAEALKKLCGDPKTFDTTAAFNDVKTPGKFDNAYYKNLPKGLGLLATDNLLYQDLRTRPFVELYAANETAFFKDFGNAMVKMSYIEVKTDGDPNGEVRRRCDAFNTAAA
ncbi:peroxidase 41-like [Mangifera indica]|uniref:peroxidase 41-like n=1 Tax=Mangifera indica TaxID=29780 RepID=UPI001CFABF16|nr:peroxidase 41-like [Mangifera indica]